MTTFIQDVFNKISLERNPALWQSNDDSRTLERLQFLSEFQETKFEQQLDRDCASLNKNSKLSQAFHQKASKTEVLDQKLALLNQALCFVPIDEESGFLNVVISRIETLFALKRHAEVLADVKLAQTVPNCPDSVEIFRFKSTLALSKDSGEVGTKSDEAIRENDLAKLKELGEKLTLKDDAPKPHKLDSLNSDYPAFSSSVAIRQTEVQGRFAVATKDLKPGDLFAVDKPSISYLDKEFVKSNCWHCLAIAKLNPLPCSQCSGVVFCSQSCKQEAGQSYHKYECKRTDVLYQAQVDVWILALRLVASKPLDFWLENPVSKITRDKTHPLHQTVVMESHNGSSEFSAPELMKEAMVAVFLTRFLISSKFFGKVNSSATFTPDQLKISAWIHHLMRVARFNSHEVTQKVQSADSKRR